MEEGILVQAHIDKFQMIADQLTNTYHQGSNEDLSFTLLRYWPPSFHTFVLSLSIHNDQLFMELVCKQFL